MVIFKPVISLIHNTKLNRWHPVYFREAPLPGPDEPGKPCRHKSGGHHTAGFATREEALASAKGNLTEVMRNNAIGDIAYALENDFPWDGEGTPAMVAFFAIDGDKATPLF